MTQAAARPSLNEAIQPDLSRWGPWRFTREELNPTMIWRYLEVAEDGNPVYWDEAFAKQSRFGRVIAPPQGIFSLTIGAWWTPDYLLEKQRQEEAALNAGSDTSGPDRINSFIEQYGYTVSTVAGHDTEFLAPFGPGDGRIKSRSKTVEVSEERLTRVGPGVFITSVTEYHTEKDDRLVARSTMVLLKYDGTRGGRRDGES